MLQVVRSIDGVKKQQHPEVHVKKHYYLYVSTVSRVAPEISWSDNMDITILRALLAVVLVSVGILMCVLVYININWDICIDL